MKMLTSATRRDKTASRPYTSVFAGIVLSSVAAVPTGVAAQEQSPQAANVQATDEIMVVARRRSEPLQAVPLAVSVVQPSQLQAAGVDSVAELPLVAPSLTSTPSPGGGRSSPNFAIRGLSQQELSILGDQSVSTYIGDVVIARVQGVNGALFDVGSIEVLRGPQGTLFGRNTTGGAVIIRPNQPTWNLEGMAAVTVGNLGTFNTEAMLNMPIGQDVSIRLAGRTLHDDGYVHDSLLGRNVNDTSQQAFRASVLIAPEGSGLEVLTSYEYFRENDGGVGTYVGAINPNAGANSPEVRASRGYRHLEDLLAEQQERGIYDIASGTPTFVKIDTHLVTNTITYEVSDRITLKNVFGYRHVRDDLRDDLDGTESSIFPQERIDKSNQLSNEFQVIGSFPRFDWIAGLYYFREKGRLQAYSAALAVDPGDVEYLHVTEYPDAGLSLTDITARNVSYAAFAQGTYELLDGLKFTAGVRYTQDKRRSIIRNRLPRGGCRFTIDDDGNPATPEVTPSLENCEVEGNKSFSEPTYNLSLDYEFSPKKLVYVAHRHGYRSGGFGSRATTEVGLTQTYDPETVDDFEVGLKVDWHLGNVFLRTNLAAFHADYKNIQRVLTDSSFVPVQSVTVNAGSARIRGLEAEILLRPVEWIDLSANYAYTDAAFKTFVTPDGVDLSSARFARAPKHVYTFGARVRPPIPAEYGEVSFGGSYYHHGSYNADDNYVAGVTDMPSYNLVNVDASWNNVMDTGFDVSASITNLTKERYSYYVANLLGLGVLPYFAGEPRRFNLTLRYHFGN